MFLMNELAYILTPAGEVNLHIINNYVEALTYIVSKIQINIKTLYNGPEIIMH